MALEADMLGRLYISHFAPRRHFSVARAASAATIYREWLYHALSSIDDIDLRLLMIDIMDIDTGSGRALFIFDISSPRHTIR